MDCSSSFERNDFMYLIQYPLKAIAYVGIYMVVTGVGLFGMMIVGGIVASVIHFIFCTPTLNL